MKSEITYKFQGGISSYKVRDYIEKKSLKILDQLCLVAVIISSSLRKEKISWNEKNHMCEVQTLIN